MAVFPTAPNTTVPPSTTHQHAIAWRIDGSEFGDSAAASYLAYHAWSGGVNFTLPWPGANRR